MTLGAHNKEKILGFSILLLMEYEKWYDLCSTHWISEKLPLDGALIFVFILSHLLLLNYLMLRIVCKDRFVLDVPSLTCVHIVCSLYEYEKLSRSFGLP